MITRAILLSSLALAGVGPALAQSAPDTLSSPVLRASVTVSSDVVRIGDVIDNAGSASQIAIYRAPDLGTTGSLPTSQLIATLRAHQVIGVDTRDIQDVAVTRAARVLAAKDIETQVARALERRNGIGDAANLAITFDRDVRDLQVDASITGDLRVANVRFEPRNNRFDVNFEIAGIANSAMPKLRFTGTAVETVATAVVTRNVERNEILKASDVSVERRPKSEAGTDVANRDRVIGMQPRRALRAGQVLKNADLGKPDFVTRDQNVTLIYQSPGLYLTGRGKAMENGAEGDIVNVMNMQSKRTVQAIVIGPGQVSIVATAPILVNTSLSPPATQTAFVDPALSNSASNTPSPETAKSE